MSTSAHSFVGWLSVGALGAAVALAAPPAGAVVTQPNGDSIPILPAEAEYGVVTSRGFARSAVELNGLFAARGETLDYKADAKTTPGAFSPVCGFSGVLVLRGGAAKASLGWYNVDDPVQPPPVYPLVPKSILDIMSGTQDNASTPAVNECVVAAQAAGALCGGGDHDFCPLATLSATQPLQHCWTNVPFQSGQIKDDIHYRKGLVGFALYENDHTKQIKYSEAKLNVPCTAAGCKATDRWVTALVWQSTVDPEGFYLGFEDLGMDQTDWHKLPQGDTSASGSCDGDFNDFVYFVSGVNCQGGNQPCNTGLQGACSVGHTDCASAGETAACRPVVQPGKETCDNVDNDCDGVVDNGDGLCPDPDKPICFQGTCVGNCSRGEFPCPNDTSCDSSGHCVDPMCNGIMCAAGTACRGGNCVDACQGAVCPVGSQCELGRCVNPCAGVTCPMQRVCSKGLCVADCNCAGCDAGLVCGTDGKCSDPRCTNCTAGQVCSKDGVCVDACDGAICPGGAACSMGMCGDPSSGGGGTVVVGPDGGLITTGGTSTKIDFTAGSGGTGAGAGSGGRLAPAIPSKGCGCRVAQTDDRAGTLAWLSAALGLGVSTWLRRRSKRAA